MESLFSKLTLKKLKIFLTIILRANDKSLDRLKMLYYEKTEFSLLIEFLEGVNLIAIENDKISCTESIIKSLNQGDRNDNSLKKIIAEQLFKKEIIYRQDILEYFSNYILSNDEYIFTSDSTENIKYSGIRNFLLEIGVVKYDRLKRIYSIRPNYKLITYRFLEKSTMSSLELKKILKKKEELGVEAERLVLQYEYERLMNYPELINKIEYIAEVDVLAGYDIKSWEDKKDTKGKEVERFIEVKSISLIEKKFYWTRNEIKKAKAYKKQYYLYLVTRTDDNNINTINIEIIRNPYIKIVKNKFWKLQVESYSCTEIRKI